MSDAELELITVKECIVQPRITEEMRCIRAHYCEVLSCARTSDCQLLNCQDLFLLSLRCTGEWPDLQNSQIAFCSSLLCKSFSSMIFLHCQGGLPHFIELARTRTADMQILAATVC